MVEADSLFTSFVQSGNSCTLASYAIASYHFTQIPPNRFFEDYCEHFGIAYTGATAELKYAQHFNNEWRRRACKGYQIIEDLHRNSRQSAFAMSREKFEVYFFLDINVGLNSIKTRLQNEETLLSVAFQVPPHVHSCAVGYDDQGWYMIETRPNLVAGVSRILSIESLGNLQDGLVMARRIGVQLKKNEIGDTSLFLESRGSSIKKLAIS